MKTLNQYLGMLAEDHAAEYLIQNGYLIRERNWRYKKAEIDIIASNEELLIFIEVKSRSYNYYGEPEIAVDLRKSDLISHAAYRYMESINYDWAIRFDIISINLDGQGRPALLKHIKDVFF